MVAPSPSPAESAVTQSPLATGPRGQDGYGVEAQNPDGRDTGRGMAGASTSKRIVRRCWIRGHTPASVVAVALLTALLALAGCEGVTSTHTTPALSPTLGAHEVTTTPAAPVKGGQIAVVAITGSVQFAYSPGNLTIPVGGSVSWQNSSSQPHTVTMDPGAPVAIPSETLQPSFVYTYTFTKAGVYHYHCAYHPYMKGTITVTP